MIASGRDRGGCDGATLLKMWIETTRRYDDGRPVTRRIKTPAMDAAVEFSETGRANVPAEVGEYLCETFDQFRPSASDSDSSDEHDESADDSETTESDSDSDS